MDVIVGGKLSCALTEDEENRRKKIIKKYNTLFKLHFRFSDINTPKNSNLHLKITITSNILVRIELLIGCKRILSSVRIL
jgi:hypothetical protein